LVGTDVVIIKTPNPPKYEISNAAPNVTRTINAGDDITVTGSDPTWTIANAAPNVTRTITAGSDIAVTGSDPTWTIANAAPNVERTITAGTNIVVSGSDPNWTLSSSLSYQHVTLSSSSMSLITTPVDNPTLRLTLPAGTWFITFSMRCSVGLNVNVGIQPQWVCVIKNITTNTGVTGTQCSPFEFIFNANVSYIGGSCSSSSIVTIAGPETFAIQTSFPSVANWLSAAINSSHLTAIKIG
jgi:hypothetical protein